MRKKNTMNFSLFCTTVLSLHFFCCNDNSSSSSPGPEVGAPEGGSTTGGIAKPTCEGGISPGPVQSPVFVDNLPGQTSWFAAPLILDVNGDGSNELISAYYSISIFDKNAIEISRIDAGDGRIYAPHVVVDIEGDGITEIIYGSDSQVFAYEWNANTPTPKAGWPVSVDGSGSGPEVRGMAGADLNGDGSIEIVVTTTETADEADGGSQVWVFNGNGTLYQPEGISWKAWPRYNAASGEGNDADRNGAGHRGYGCYGLNVGIGNIDDDDALEIIVTYDNHHIQAFDHTGVAIDASSWFTNRGGENEGNPLTWGQFIRWADPLVEEQHYHEHTGEWPHPSWAEWLQWTHSPPSVVDLDLDGRNEIIGAPNVEMHEPYETQAYAIMVLNGAHGDGSLSAMRKAGWESLPRGERPVSVEGWYPPSGVPAIVTANIQGDPKLEIIVSLNDRFIYAFDAQGELIWRYNFSHGKKIMFASEATVADLNQDGSPEILFTTYGDPEVLDSGNLVVLAADGQELYSIPLPDPGQNGNGNGAPAAPSVGDLDGDGELEIFVQTFDHGMDVFEVPGSGTNCVLWPTARGGPLRMGQPSDY